MKSSQAESVRFLPNARFGAVGMSNGGGVKRPPVLGGRRAAALSWAVGVAVLFAVAIATPARAHAARDDDTGCPR